MPKRKLIAADRIVQRNTELKRRNYEYLNFSIERIRSIVWVFIDVPVNYGGLKMDSALLPKPFPLVFSERNFLYAVLQRIMEY